VITALSRTGILMTLMALTALMMMMMMMVMVMMMMMTTTMPTVVSEVVSRVSVVEGDACPIVSVADGPGPKTSSPSFLSHREPDEHARPVADYLFDD
jgi:hypothetical protein